MVCNGLQIRLNERRVVKTEGASEALYIKAPPRVEEVCGIRGDMGKRVPITHVSLRIPRI